MITLNGYVAIPRKKTKKRFNVEEKKTSCGRDCNLETSWPPQHKIISSGEYLLQQNRLKRMVELGARK